MKKPFIREEPLPERFVNPEPEPEIDPERQAEINAKVQAYLNKKGVRWIRRSLEKDSTAADGKPCGKSKSGKDPDAKRNGKSFEKISMKV